MTTNEIADELRHRVYGIRNETRPNGLLSFHANTRSTATPPAEHIHFWLSLLCTALGRHERKQKKKKQRNNAKDRKQEEISKKKKKWKKERGNENPKLNWTQTAYSSGPSQRVALHTYCFKVVSFVCLFIFFSRFCRYSSATYFNILLFFIRVSWILFLYSLLPLVRRTFNTNVYSVHRQPHTT